MTSSTCDLIVSGGVVFEGDDQPRRADVAVAGGRIVAVGSDVRRMHGPRTEVIDAVGGLVTPGFIDAHVHPVTGGRKLNEVSLEEATDAGDALRLLTEYARAHPEREWIWGGGLVVGVVRARDAQTPAASRSGGRGPACVSLQPRRPWCLGQQQSSRVGRDRSRHARPSGRPDRTRTIGARPQGTLHEGAMALVEALAPKTEPRRLGGGAPGGSGLPPVLWNYRMAGRRCSARARAGLSRPGRLRWS